MRYEKTKDILDEAKSLHEGLAQYYQRLSREASGEKVRMLLDYLARHEENLAEVLRRYELEAAARIRDAWFRFVPDADFLACIPPAKPVADMDIDEIVDLAIHLDDCIIDLYQLVALRSELPEVRTAFTSLVAQERQEKMRMVRQAMGLKDL